MTVSDEVLLDKLRSYTKRIAQSLSFSDGIKHQEAGTSHVEYQGKETEANFLTFAWRILDTMEVVDGERCVRLSTEVCDRRRFGLGSVYTPLCSGAWIFESGRVEFHPLGNLAASPKRVDF